MQVGLTWLGIGFSKGPVYAAINLRVLQKASTFAEA
jgi:hypothetical protein